jgi:hypothetical protein
VLIVVAAGAHLRDVEVANEQVDTHEPVNDCKNETSNSARQYQAHCMLAD